MSSAVLSETPVGDALPLAVLLIGRDGAVVHANPAAKELFGTIAAVLAKIGLSGIISPFSSLIAMVEQVRQNTQTLFEHDVELDLPRVAGPRLVDVRAAPLAQEPDLVVLSLAMRTVAEQLGRHFKQCDAGQSNASMAATLALEVRNPLPGIRGAAQLLESGASEEEKALARMNRDESDRIAALIDRKAIFGDESTARDLATLNVHELLDHLQLVAKPGVAGQVETKTKYDPSLPLVAGSRDELIQAFLNLFKNAAEALLACGGVITIRTRRYEHGLHVRGSGRLRVQLPIAIRIEDNGAGIAEELRDCLFDPFLSGKSGGAGLGLAPVVRIVADPGGVVDVKSKHGNTIFRILLPAAEQGSAAR